MWREPQEDFIFLSDDDDDDKGHLLRQSKEDVSFRITFFPQQKNAFTGLAEMKKVCKYVLSFISAHQFGHGANPLI